MRGEVELSKSSNSHSYALRGNVTLKLLTVIRNLQFVIDFILRFVNPNIILKFAMEELLMMNG